jgi:mono/diheme cytochrome c family protein
MLLPQSVRLIGIDSVVSSHRARTLYRNSIRCDSRGMPGFSMRQHAALSSSGARLFAKAAFLCGAVTLCACFPAALLGAIPAQSTGTSSAAYDQGAAVFATSGCARCHGKNGMGGGHGPNLRDVGDHWSEVKIRKQIENGGEHMPAYGKILDSKQVDELVHYLSAHREAAEPPAAPAP